MNPTTSDVNAAVAATAEPAAVRGTSPQGSTGMTYADEHHVLPSRFGNAMPWLLLLVVALGDAANFYIALAILSGAELWIVGLLTFALTAAAVALMHNAGHMAREIRAKRATHGWRRVVVQTVAWLMLGVGAFYLRMLEAVEAASGASGAFGETGTATSIWLTYEGAMAVLMMFVYLAGGAIAYAVGYSTFNPARSAYFRAKKHLKKLEKERDSLVSEIATIDQRLASARPVAEDVHEARRDQLVHIAVELKEHARLRILTTARATSKARHEANSDTLSALAELDEAIRQKELEMAALNNVLNAARNQANAKAEELRQHVRLTMAAAHGDPATTSILTHTTVVDGPDALAAHSPATRA